MDYRPRRIRRAAHREHVANLVVRAWFCAQAAWNAGYTLANPMVFGAPDVMASIDAAAADALRRRGWRMALRRLDRLVAGLASVACHVADVGPRDARGIGHREVGCLLSVDAEYAVSERWFVADPDPRWVPA